VDSLEINDIKNRYQTVLSPRNIKVALIGNWLPAAERHIIAEFSDLEAKELSAPSSKVTVNEKSKERVFYSKKGLEQAQVKMGVTTVSRSSPDFLPLSIGLKVLGGSFKSLLNEELRVKRGLTYGVSAGVRAYSQGGLIIISSAVRHDKLVQFVDVAERVMSDFVNRGISQSELDKMKALYAGEYPRSLETLEQEASMYLSYEALGFSGSEIYKFLGRVQKVTKDQVDGALRRQLDLNRLNLTVLGDVTKVKDLNKLQVKVVKL
jgi:zinc protease